MSFSSIAYVVLLPAEDVRHYSPFQGFPRGLLQREWVFSSIVQLMPPTVTELYLPSVGSLQHRIAGLSPYRIAPLDQSQLQYLRIVPQQPFVVVFTDAQTHDAAENWRSAAEIAPLLVRYDEDIEGKPSTIREAFRERLCNHCERIFDLIKENFRDEYPTYADALRGKRIAESRIELVVKYRRHLTTAPNERALISVGGQYGPASDPPAGLDKQYVAAIVDSVDELAEFRSTIPGSNLYRAARPPCTLVLSAPAFYRHVYQLRQIKGGLAPDDFKVLRLLQKQTTYGVFEEQDVAMRLVERPAFRTFLEMRTRELRAISSALTVRAASHLCPILRLPPGVNHVWPAVIQLADTLATGQPHIRKIQKTANKLFENVAQYVDQEFVDRIDQFHTHVKIVADAPLEWLPIRGVPLMLRQSVSRIPATPGALAFSQAIPPPDIHLSSSDFREVLVIRSFRSNDRMRTHLQLAVETYGRSIGAEGMPVRFVDVASRDELIAALNNFDGAFAIFDGHGSHDKRTDIAGLIVGGAELDVLSLREEVKMPPIFFACACDTHAVNRSHATVANGLLYCGARAVIASVMPIRSTTAAIVTGRLLFRLFSLLPQLAGKEATRAIRWDELFSVVQRMMFVSEMMRAIIPPDQMEKDSWMQVQAHCTHLIHSSGTAWYEEVTNAIAIEMGTTAAEVQQLQGEQLPFPEILKYLQFGNPEAIIIGPDEPPTEWYTD